jgi:hypothetical protein
MDRNHAHAARTVRQSAGRAVIFKLAAIWRDALACHSSVPLLTSKSCGTPQRVFSRDLARSARSKTGTCRSEHPT